jgi:hypothetical protein
MTERRPGIFLGSPVAFLMAGVICLVVAGLFPLVLYYQGRMLCPFGRCGSGLLQYVAYPLLYIGWMLVVVGACALVCGIIFGRSRPTPPIIWHDQVNEQRTRASSPGVEEPALFHH